ncbi:hypothetical protein Spea_3189 [Shewanella pealeana ATCC 700345]|uniref:Uncharacterized protein n=1 Tax=Shewanella pealeana (strain ATCC 700345 / ANG-SQ1) TaxID=398579 RepID=A8H7G8_SHEPA|nr:hypothetical protein Spea_3189 [Shewanella pealeana ATCC 700345]
MVKGTGSKSYACPIFYQANSLKHRNVLSNQFIGLRAYKDKNLKRLKSHWQIALKTLQGLVRKPQAYY